MLAHTPPHRVYKHAHAVSHVSFLMVHTLKLSQSYSHTYIIQVEMGAHTPPGTALPRMHTPRENTQGVTFPILRMHTAPHAEYSGML